MLPFEFYSPTKFIFSPTAETEIGPVFAREGYRKILIVTGQASVFDSGLYDRVTGSLDEHGIEHHLLRGVKPNPLSDLVYEGTRLGRSAEVDLVLGLGGGSAIDTAKAIALAIPYDGDFWDFYSGKAAPQTALPVATVLSLAATGSEASPSSVITNAELGKKRGVNSDLIRPVLSFMNPALAFTLPAYQIACGVTDIMAHILERYFTKTEHVELTDELAEALLRVVYREGPKALRERDNYEVNANLFWAGALAHNNLMGVGREQDWSSHQIAHELSTKYDLAHGAALAIVMPNFMRYTVDVIPARYARLAMKVFGVEPSAESCMATALEGIKRFQRFLRDLGMPITLQEVGGKEEDIVELAANTRLTNGEFTGFPKPLDLAAKEEILRLSLETPDLH